MATLFYRFRRRCARAVPMLCLAVAASTAVPRWTDPLEFVRSRAAGHDVLLLGTRHRQPAILAFVGNLLPVLKATGVTHIGLEIGAHQQAVLDDYLDSGRGLEDLVLHPQIDCVAYRGLLAALRQSGLSALAIDRSSGAAAPPLSRDRYMAHRVAALFRKRPGARLVAVVGNLHTLKRYPWRTPAVTDTGIRPALAALRPDLRVVSIAQWTDPEPLAPSTPRPLALVADGLNGAPAFLAAAALLPMSTAAAVDGLILH